MVRHIVEISKHDVMTYHKKSHLHRPWATTLNFAYGNARLVTLAPLARGLPYVFSLRYRSQEHIVLQGIACPYFCTEH